MLLVELEREARRRVREVRDQPQGRLRLREVFYENYGFPERAGVARHGFGKSELDFLAWEIERGVLNSPQHPEKPGSPWWRAVNEDFLYWGELAALVQGSQLPQGQAPRLVRHWLRYIKEPSAVTWYRAHNASIIQAYLDHVPRAMQESPGEQLFMNVVLYRVLYAQAMVEGCDYAFADLGRLLANPCFPAVHVLLELPDFYPRSYPLSEQEVRDLMHCGHDLADVVVDVFDEFFIAKCAGAVPGGLGLEPDPGPAAPGGGSPPGLPQVGAVGRSGRSSLPAAPRHGSPAGDLPLPGTDHGFLTSSGFSGQRAPALPQRCDHSRLVDWRRCARRSLLHCGSQGLRIRRDANNSTV